MTQRQYLTPFQTAAATSFLLLLIYIGTLAPTLFVHDSAELAAGAISLGIVHSPGYAVYLLVARAFASLPFGDVAYRINLLSAVSTAFATFLLIRILLRLQVTRIVASVTGLVFGLSFYTWSLSVITEVYTFQVLLLAILLWSALLWQETGHPRWLYITAFFLGVSVVNNPATGLWWGGIVLLLGWRIRTAMLTQRMIGNALLLFIAGCAFLLYLPLRSLANPALNYAGHYDEMGVFHPLQLTNLNNLIWYVTGGPFQSLIGNYTRPELLIEVWETLVRLNAAFLGIGLPLGLVGGGVLWRRNRPIILAVLLTLIPHLLFFTSYRALDKETMFLPVYFLWALLLGIGLDWLMQRLPAQIHLLAWTLPFLFFAVNRGFIDVQDYEVVQVAARERLESAEADSIYFGIWGDAAAMEYLQTAEGIRPDVLVISTFLIHPETQRALIENTLDAGRAVYVIHKDPTLARAFRFTQLPYSFQLKRP